MLIDLHIHSTASDGTLSPRQIMELAAQRNIGVLSITDHDTFEGSKKAIYIQKEYNIEVIPGIEINSIYGDEEIHILGYYIDFNNLKLIRILQSLQNSRNYRISKIVSILNSYKFSITEEEVYGIAQSDSPGRPHIARLLVQKGYVPNIKFAFDNYLSIGKPAYVSRLKLTPKEAIRIIKKANGLPVIAHPGILKNKGLLPKLITDGAMGLEVFHPEHTMEQTNFLLNYGINKGLFITGGSDCHGPFQGKPAMLGSVTLNGKNLKEIKNWSYLKNH